MTRFMNSARLGSSDTPSRSRFLAATAGIVAASLIAFVPIASAGKPSAKGGGKPSGGSATISLVLVNSPDSVPNWGEQVRFNVSAAATTEPHVDLDCAQGGARVYFAQTGYYDGYPWPWTQTFTLRSGAWSGGAADCTAKLYWFNGSKTVTGATLAFHVYA
jgi:hypothetical protein